MIRDTMMGRDLQLRGYCFVLIGILTAIPLSSVFSEPIPEEPAVNAVLSVDRQDIFERETFTLTLTITNTGVRLSQAMKFGNFSPDNKLELIGGFTNFKVRPSVKNRNTHTIERFVTKARIKTPGKIRIAPKLHATHLVKRRSFFGFSYRTSPYTIQVKPLKLYIHKIPKKGRPSNFSEAVGQCFFDVNISPTNLAVGELITAAMNIKCRGPLDDLPAPAISPGRHFKAYPSKLVEGESSSTNKMYQQILVPQSTNAVTIPTISFSYFDPRAKSYKAITRGPFPLHFQTAEPAPDIPYRPPVFSNATTVLSQTTSDATSQEHPDIQVVELSYTSTIIAITASIAGLIVVIFWITLRPRRLTIAILLSAIIAVQIISLLHAFKSGLFDPPAAVAIHSGTARIAPSSTSLQSFEVKKGLILHIIKKHKNWYKIETRNKRGWIPADM